MKICVTIMAVMLCLAVCFYSFGVPYSSDFFKDFNVARDEVFTFTEPIVTIGNTLRTTYGAVDGVIDGFNYFREHISFWQGELSYWAVAVCGLKSPYDMSVAECYDKFREFNDFLRKEIPDADVRAALVAECARYVVFALDKNGNLIPTYTGTPSTFAWLWDKAPNYLDKIFTFIGKYSYWDTVKCFGNGYYVNAIGSVGVDSGYSFGRLPIYDEGVEHSTYVWLNHDSYAYAKTLYGDDFAEKMLPFVELIPFSAEAFMKRCGATPPDKSIMPYKEEFKNCPW